MGGIKEKVVVVVVFVVMAGVLFFVQRSERSHYEHRACTQMSEARTQGNIRAKHLLLLEAALINSSNASKELGGYHPPGEIAQLEGEPKVVPLPEIKC